MDKVDNMYEQMEERDGNYEKQVEMQEIKPWYHI